MRLLLEPRGTVVGVADYIVAADGHDAHGLAYVVLSQRGQASLNVLHVGAVSAHEHDQKRLFAAKDVAADDVAGDHIGERELRRSGAQFQHSGFGE